MHKLAVVIPSWTTDRALAVATEMHRRAAHPTLCGGGVAVEYVIVGPKTPDYTPTVVTPEKLGTLEAMHRGACLIHHWADVLCFLHDDVDILEAGWDDRIREHFSAHPGCGLAGFGGARDFGAAEIYKTPYDLMQLIRYDFISNMKDAEAHGARATTPQQVTFLDGFSLLFRRECYREIGGWAKLLAEGFPPFHSYDMRAAIEVARAGWEMWMIPVACHHWGGKTSTTDEYQEWIKTRGWRDGHEVFEKGHEMTYARGRGILPLRAPRCT